jgi:hypothetical protein
MMEETTARQTYRYRAFLKADKNNAYFFMEWLTRD